jgi:hypothetical protein
MIKVYKLLFSVVALAAVLFSSRCTKIDSTTLGQDLIPPIDGVNTLLTDTFTITTENGIFTDTSRFNKTDNYLLGQLVTDPLFGRTDATIYTELKPAFQFQWRAKLDSILAQPGGGYDSSFLSLAYVPGSLEKGVYGDSNSVVSFRVWAITNNSNFNKDSSYLIANDPNIPHSQLIGTASVKPSDLKNQQVVVLKRDTFRLNNVIRFRLNATGDNIMRDLLTKDTNNVFKNDDNFRSYFKGFVIEPVGSGGNAIMKISLTDLKTRLEVWYRFTKNGVADTSFDAFSFNSLSGNPYRCASANHVKRNLTGAAVNNYLAPGVDSVIFLQSTPGTFATIKVPYIKSFPNKIIHRAELVMEENPAFSSILYTSPLNIYMDVFDTAPNKFRTVPFDFYFINPITGPADFTYFGGNRKILSDGGGERSQYTFNITKYLQGMISRNDPYYHFRLYCPFDIRYHNQYVPGIPWPVITTPTFGRVVLGGGNSVRYRMKLRVIYSNI